MSANKKVISATIEPEVKRWLDEEGVNKSAKINEMLKAEMTANGKTESDRIKQEIEEKQQEVQNLDEQKEQALHDIEILQMRLAEAEKMEDEEYSDVMEWAEKLKSSRHPYDVDTCAPDIPRSKRYKILEAVELITPENISEDLASDIKELQIFRQTPGSSVRTLWNGKKWGYSEIQDLINLTDDETETIKEIMRE